MPGITPGAEHLAPLMLDRRELLRPWKLASFMVGTALMVIGVDYYNISDWDIGISLIMPGLTYLTAPWVMRVILQGHWRSWPEALFWTWFTVDGVYWWYHTTMGNEMLRLENLKTSLPLYLFMGGIWLYRGSLRELLVEVRNIRQPCQDSTSHRFATAPTPPSRRQHRQRNTFIALMLVAALYSLAIEPFWIDVTRHRIGRPNVSTKSARIVQLSDLHFSTLGWRETLIIKQLMAQAPDAIVITGDAIDRQERLADFERFLAQLPKVPKYAVLGNWEYWSKLDLARFREVCQNQGVKVLDNQSVVVSTAAGRFIVTGLDDAREGHADWSKAIASIPDLLPVPLPNSLPHIVLQHTPEWRDMLTRTLTKSPLILTALVHKPPLAILSGHSHGGQINVFGWRPILPPGSGAYTAGWYQDDGGVPLYVSRGLGTSVLPLRFGARPEIAVFELAF